MRRQSADGRQGLSDGLVVVRRGVGMFVADGAARKLRDAERRTFLKERWPEICAHMRRLGLEPDELVAQSNIAPRVLATLDR
jgi:GntR family transcriptional regulator